MITHDVAPRGAVPDFVAPRRAVLDFTVPAA